MIKGSFKRTGSGRIVSFELTGHAEAGPYGSDVVCAAVSALAISTVNGIDALAGFEPIVEVDDVEGGYLYVRNVPHRQLLQITYRRHRFQRSHLDKF